VVERRSDHNGTWLAVDFDDAATGADLSSHVTSAAGPRPSPRRMGGPMNSTTTQSTVPDTCPITDRSRLSMHPTGGTSCLAGVTEGT
jgi:hypothetical protein